MKRSSPRIGGPLAALSAFLCIAILSASRVSQAGEATGDSPPKADRSASSTGSTAPDFSVSGVDGKVYSLKSLLEKGPVLLNFWTTWCKPCKLEIPHLQRIYDAYKDQGFTLLGVPSDDTRTAAQVKPSIRSMRMTFPNLPDQSKVLGNLYNVRNYPTTVLISRDGRIAHYAQGYRPGDEKKLEEMITALLSGSEKESEGTEGDSGGASGEGE